MLNMNTRSEKFYNRFAFMYPVIDLFLRPQKRKFFSTINGYPNGQLLDIGVGNGAHFKYYSTHKITGIDTSRNMVMQAQKQAGGNIHVLQMNGENLSFRSGVFDYVILSHVLAVVEDPERLLEEVYRVLKPGGKIFILNHFTPNNWLRYVDEAFGNISRRFHFKSVFHVSDLHQIEKFKMLRSFNAGPFSYFKILIYEKSI